MKKIIFFVLVLISACGTSTDVYEISTFSAEIFELSGGKVQPPEIRPADLGIRCVLDRDFYKNLSSSPGALASDSVTAHYPAGLSITADESLFGEEPGAELQQHFLAGLKISDEMMPADTFFKYFSRQSAEGFELRFDQPTDSLKELIFTVKLSLSDGNSKADTLERIRFIK